MQMTRQQFEASVLAQEDDYDHLMAVYEQLIQKSHLLVPERTQ